MTGAKEWAKQNPNPGPKEETRLPAVDLSGLLVSAGLQQAFERLNARAEGLEKPIATPFVKLNEKLGGGLWPGSHFLIGNTGSGKTQLAQQIAFHAASMRIPVMYISLEIGRFELTVRLFGLLANEKWSRLFTGKVPPQTLVRAIEQHRAALESLPIFILEGGPHGWSYEQLYELAAAMRKKYPAQRPGENPFLVVVDFVQIVGSPPDQREDLRERIGRAVYRARAAARDFDAAVLLLSSTSREKYKLLTNDGKDPSDDDYLGFCSPAKFIGLGKESGEAEYSADTVLFLGRQTEAIDPKKPSVIHLGIAKLRAGLPDWVEFHFDGGQFTEIGADNVVRY